MCFSQEMSGALSVGGMLVAVWVLRSSGNAYVASGVFYFVLMEMLQFAQYFYIADDVDPVRPTAKALAASSKCQAAENQFLTFLGFLHICFQPLFTHYMTCGFASSKGNLGQFLVVRRLCIVGGLMMMMRGLLALFPGFFATVGLGEIFGNAGYFGAGGDNGHLPREWLSGETLCTYKGKSHLAWSVPLISPSYYVPAMSLHSFLMFVPFFVMDKGSMMANVANWVGGAILFFTGPILGDYITGNKHEAASIWCFFSMCQICILVFIMFLDVNKRKRWFLSDVAKYRDNGNHKEKST